MTYRHSHPAASLALTRAMARTPQAPVTEVALLGFCVTAYVIPARPSKPSVYVASNRVVTKNPNFRPTAAEAPLRYTGNTS